MVCKNAPMSGTCGEWGVAVGKKAKVKMQKL